MVKRRKTDKAVLGYSIVLAEKIDTIIVIQGKDKNEPRKW
jgi:hypothetical protein